MESDLSYRVISRSREEIKQWIVSHGGKVLSAISGNVDYLLAGEKWDPQN